MMDLGAGQRQSLGKPQLNSNFQALWGGIYFSSAYLLVFKCLLCCFAMGNSERQVENVLILF